MRTLGRRSRGAAAAAGAWVVLVCRMAAADVAVLPAEGANVDPGEAAAIGVLLTDAYAERSRTRAFGAQATGPLLEEKGSPEAVASALGAEEYITLRVVKLGETYSLSASRFSADGKLIHGARISAASLDDTAPAADRLARALFEESTTGESRALSNITEKEGKRPNRVRTETVAGLKTGLSYPIAKGERFVPMLTINYDGRHEGSSFFIEWGVGVVVPTREGEDRHSYGGLHLEFGASYYLTQTNISPYLGVGVLPRLLTSGVSVAPYGQAGLMFLRHSSTRLYTDVRVAQHVLPQQFDPLFDFGDEEGETDDFYPTEVTVSVGVGW